QLSELGYRPLPAEDSEQALELLAQQRIDVLFTDFIIPGGANGYDLAQRVLSRSPQTKVILTSGFPDAAIEHSAGTRAIRVLAKPYQGGDVAHVIREVLDCARQATTPGEPM